MNIEVFSPQKNFIQSGCMAGKYNVNETIELLFDGEFGRTEGEISEQEGEHAYCYRGEGIGTTLEASWLAILQASLSMNQRAIVKEQLEILTRGRLGLHSLVV